MRLATCSALAAFGLICATSPAPCAPLDASALYTTRTRACRTLDLTAWSHPTRDVMERAKIEVRKVELCNGAVYPVFTVRLPATPMLGVNDKFFNRLYANISVANGFHSFALVDPAWGVIVTVEVTGKRELSVDYEEFDALGEK